MTARGVIFDLVAAQSPSYRGRGIARYSTDLVRAVVRWRPDLVSAVALHPELPMPEGLDDLGEWLTTEPDWESASVIHLSSVIEPEVPVRTFWPREASAHHLLVAVTLYDLIPDLFPGWYLEDPGLRRRWRCCREVVRAADAVLTMSGSARQDAIDLLGIPEHRVTVIGSGTSPEFRRPESRSAALKVARRGVKGLKKGFLLYNGAFNPRKNVDRLLEAYASLPPELLTSHQLVIVCEAPPLTRNHYLLMAEDLGAGGRVLIPGFVPDDVLVALHQSADLAVYPSLYEGYGLPVVDALACGTPALAGDNSALRERLPREARFQPEDPGAIREAIVRALTDKAFRERLLALTEQEPPSWADVVGRAAPVFEEMLRRAGKAPPGWRRRPKLALVGLPGPLAEALCRLADCDAFEASEDGTTKEGTLSLAALPRLDPWRGGYDSIVAWAGQPGDLATVEGLAARSTARTVVVLPGGANQDEALIPKLEALGLNVVLAPRKADWERAAHLVAVAARLW